VTERVLYNIVKDLCSFILKEVIPCDVKYHDVTGVLARLEYRMLTDISRLQLSRDSYYTMGENFDVHNV
jgi:hypothetical protein